MVVSFEANGTAHQVPQCGYCQSRMIMAVSALIQPIDHFCSGHWGARAYRGSFVQQGG
jgi:hypothetical protein